MTRIIAVADMIADMGDCMADEYIRSGDIPDHNDILNRLGSIEYVLTDIEEEDYT